jgi:DHA2 family methylenomycin A resistance protein-like MFS transporter
MRQTGSVVGVALFGSLIAQKGMFLHGLHLSLLLSVVMTLLATAISLWGLPKG